MWKRGREVTLLALGAAGFLHELLLSGPSERPFMLALIAAMLGLPFVMRAEDFLKGDKSSKNGNGESGS